MNNLSIAYNYYCSVDKLLELLIKRENKSVYRKSIVKSEYWNKVIELAQANGLVVLSVSDRDQLITATDKGIAHLERGGFQVFDVEPSEGPQKSFKEHLDDMTGLLTIFGILNAILIFASQFEISTAKEFDFVSSGATLISISMYVLSLVVLWEIIWETLSIADHRRKFELFYILLCSTTIGIGMLFISQFEGLILGLIIFAVLIGVIWLLNEGFIKILGLGISSKNALWFKKTLKVWVAALLILSIILGGLIVKLLAKWIFNS